MSPVHKIFVIVHLASTFFWLVGLNFIVLIVDFLSERFDMLKPLVNFRNDLNLLCHKIFNITFGVIIFSGVALLLQSEKNIYEGANIFFFFSKLALVITIYFTSLPFLKIPLVSKNNYLDASSMIKSNAETLELVQVKKIDLRKYFLVLFSILLIGVSIWNR